MLVEPGVFRAAVLLRPMLVYEPTERRNLSGTAALISAGRMDPIVSAESVEELVRLFESEGAEVTLKWQLTGHNLVPSEIKEAADWLALRRAPV